MKRLRNLAMSSVILGLAAAFCGGNAQAAENGSQLERQVLGWMSRNYVDPDRSFLLRIQKQLKSDFAAGNDFKITFGPKTMRSGRTTQIHVFAGTFHRFELSTSQARKVLSGPSAVSYAGGRRGYQTDADRMTLRSLSIRNVNGRISGSFSYSRQQTVPSKLAVRLTYRHGRNTTQSLHYVKTSIDTNGRLTFSFDDPFKAKKGEKKITGPMVVFIDVAAVQRVSNAKYGNVKIPTIFVYSNSLPAMIDLY